MHLLSNRPRNFTSCICIICIQLFEMLSVPSDIVCLLRGLNKCLVSVDSFSSRRIKGLQTGNDCSNLYWCEVEILKWAGLG